MPTTFRLAEHFGAQIDDALRMVLDEADPGNREALTHVLLAARRQWDRAKTQPSIYASDPSHSTASDDKQGDEFALSLVLSALGPRGDDAAITPKPAAELFINRQLSRTGTGPDRLVGRPPYSRYSDLDPRWVKALLNYLKSPPRPFPSRIESAGRDEPRSGLISLKQKARIAIAGDWGTGNASSLSIGKQIASRNPEYTIHLGDVYYSGMPDEERANFIDPWPAGSVGTFALNSNHEMYSGGAGYFDGTLSSPKFKAQGGLSYFLLENDDWAIFGLDTAYYSSSFLYEKGQLDPAQLDFLHRHGRAAFEDGKQVILLTHHNALTLDAVPVEPLWSQVTDALGRQGLCYWFWGHAHAAASFKSQRRDYESGPLEIRARCAGHGGVPFAPIPANAQLDWSEDKTFSDDHDFPNRALNGFVMLTLDGATLVEEFCDETGAKRF